MIARSVRVDSGFRPAVPALGSGALLHAAPQTLYMHSREYMIAAGFWAQALGVSSGHGLQA